MRRPAVAALTALLASVLAVAAVPATAQSWTPAAYSARLLTLVNGARADAGLVPLGQTVGTTDVAAGWTDHQAATRTLAHNPDLRHQLETHGSADWTTYGENVGEGAADDPDALFDAYMRSPEHRANILTRAYRFVGVAVTFTGRTAWNTFDFVDAYTDGAARGSSTGGSHVTATHASQPAQPAHTAVRPATAPTSAPTSAPSPPAHPAAAPARPVAHHPAAAPSHRSAPARPHVRALRRPWSEPLAAAPAAPVAAEHLPAAPVHALGDRDPDPRTRAVAVALAVLLVAAAGRRWALTSAVAVVPAAAGAPVR